MRINNNIAGLNSHRMYLNNTASLSKRTERLSSGFRVNRSGDDAAGLAISEKMRTQIRGLNMASKNSLDGISLVQTIEGALAGVQNKIQRIRELTVQGANETNTQLDRNMIALEIFHLSREVRQTEDQVTFNNMKVLDTRAANTFRLNDVVIQAGANEGDTMEFDMDLDAITNIPGGYSFDNQSLLFITSSMLNHAGLALQGAQGDNNIAGSAFDYSGRDDYTSPGGFTINNNITGLSQTEWISFMIGNVDAALNNISMIRANLGAYQNRLEFKIQNLDNSAENLAAAESRIRDVDMAREMTEFTKFNILYQASTAMLAQANTLPQSVLSLLQ